MVALISTILALITSMATVGATSQIDISPDDPLIWYHGRWDSDRGTWWNGTGLALYVKDLTSLSLQLGPNTTQPSVAVGLSVNYGPFVDLQLTNGTNSIPLTGNSTTASTALDHPTQSQKSVIRLVTEGWENNNIHLKKIILNAGASLLPYTPSHLTFQFIGDSLSSGQYLTNGVIGSWTFLTAQEFKAEQRINAQPGACLTDQVCWGNAHGLTYQFFKTEDTGYFYNSKHNFTTNWDFNRDWPATHVFLEAGANDNYYKVTSDSITETYVEFIQKLRVLYPTQPIFVLGAWGWPTADGTVGQYYTGVFESVVQKSHTQGDKHVYFIDTTGWVTYADIFPDNEHPNPSGHAKVAGLLKAWLENWGLQPERSWPTQPS